MQTTPNDKPDKLEWHRLLGMFLTAHFQNSPYSVEIEKDLALKRQVLDVILIERDQTIPFDRYPDGLENMAQYNLISYKSLSESFDLWSFQELHGHYVNCRKQVSPAMNKLINAEHFRLYALSTRMPYKLMKTFAFKGIREGVYELEWEDLQTRLIVLSRIPQGPYNEIWRLFSARPEIIEEARTHYAENRHSDYSLLVQQLYEYYTQEELPMTYTRQQFEEDFVLRHLRSVPPDQVLSQYSPEERLKNLSAEERLKNLSPEQVFRQYSAEDMLKGLSPEQLDLLLQLSQKKTSH